MNNSAQPRFFYQFLGVHSLLIGLLPFFLPVFLWQHGIDLAALSILIGISGLCFAASLGLWQKWSCSWPLLRLVKITFVLELLLVACVGLLTSVPGAALFETVSVASGGSATGSQITNNQNGAAINQQLFAALCIGIANGVYNAFFWTTQRTLFLQQLSGNDSGKQYGNFQIFVTVVLKIGILAGGWLLESGGIVWLLALSAGISFAASSYFAQSVSGAKQQRSVLHQTQRVTLRESLSFSDTKGSRPVFMVDGFFLYLESHFWTLSLFFLVQEDYGRLGVAVVILALVFAALFYLIKNRIDQLAVEQVYRSAVYLYAFSWLLRFTLDDESAGPSLWIALIVITFFSSFFRLAMNKRFFDIARQTGQVRYLLIKSYLSQSWLGLGFLLLGVTIWCLPAAGIMMMHRDILQFIYLPAAALSLMYLRYLQDN